MIFIEINMAIQKIQTGEKNPILRKMSVEVKKFDAGLKKFAKDLRETMIKKDGLGLAAPQIGENIRVIATSMNYGENNKVVVIMVNPVITWTGDEMVIAEEGCLSLPGIFKNIERFKELTVEFLTIDGDKSLLKLEGLNARVIQHEIDHLDGVLFVDMVK